MVTKTVKPSYMQKLEWGKTWSRIPLKECYKPEDIAGSDYTRIGDPGEYPYTRGIYRDMYRGRIWTIREISGRCTPTETNKQFKSLFERGETGINVIPDLPYQLGLDDDHPFSAGDVGVQGVPANSLDDAEKMMAGIDQRDVSITFSTIWPIMQAQYTALAQKRGVDIAELRGTSLNDVLHSIGVGQVPLSPPLDMGFKLAVDALEYAVRYMPRWYPMCPDAYDLREHGISAAQEIGFIFELAMAYIDEVLKRGLDIDQVAPKVSFTMSAHLDIFEEVAKFRAARRIWANLMKEKYNAKDAKSLKFKYHCNTAGTGTFRPQPLNNLMRITIMALSAVLSGCQSLQCVRFDEPINLPTDMSDRLAVRTQQIILHESGVANVADPLGGSYYIESLTDKLEEDIRKIMAEIEEQGGGYKIVENGWLLDELHKAAYIYQHEIETGERIVVGQNAFQISPEEEEKEELTGMSVYQVNAEAVEEHLRNLAELKETRDQSSLRKAVDNLRRVAENHEVNVFPAIIEACHAYVTHGEIDGILREAWGYGYDPYRIIKNPFK